MKHRGFETISIYEGKGIHLPVRKTAASAGYDLEAAEDTVLEPGKVAFVPTGLKAYMEQDEVLLLYIRSGMAAKHQVLLVNSVGVIDADYYDNRENEGHILVALLNLGKEPVHVAKGMRICQGIFVKYLTTDGDCAGQGDLRRGGFGSTGAQ